MIEEGSMKPITENTLFYCDNLEILHQFIADASKKEIERENDVLCPNKYADKRISTRYLA